MCLNRTSVEPMVMPLARCWFDSEDTDKGEKLEGTTPVVASLAQVNGQPEATVNAEDKQVALSNPPQSDDMGTMSDTVTILHFNDVYNIEPRDQEPVGGAARFKTAIDSLRHLNPMVLFSGDVFNPSLMSTITKGKHMVPVLNAMNIQCSVYGNHDFDFGVDVLVDLAKQCNFPWLMSNVTDNLTDEPLAEGIVTHTIEWQGRKFGIMGLVEEEWMATLATIDADDITFIDYVAAARELATQLKEQGCTYIIALTHMRWPNDTRLAEMVEEIDIVLGGHDHDYNKKLVNGKWVLKSGTDFRNFSQITLNFVDDKVDVNIEEIVIDSSVEEDPDIKAVVTKYLDIMGTEMETVIGNMEVELEGRFNKIRTEETNLGNFVTDIMLRATNSEIAMVNSGTFRSDTLHPKGQFRIKDLVSILPMIDSLVVLELTGQQVIEAVENGVSQYPKLEGRFPQVAGISFAFDPSKPAGQRVDPEFVKIQNNYLVLDRTYRLVTKEYLSEGKDGYDVFKSGKVVLDSEEAPKLTTIVQNHFEAIQQLKKDQQEATFRHHQSIIPVTRRRSLVKQMTLNIDETSTANSTTSSQSSLVSPGAISPSRCRGLLQRRASIQSVEIDESNHALAPEVEGRIMVLDEQRRSDLVEAKLCSGVRETIIIETSESVPSTPTTLVGAPTF